MYPFPVKYLLSGLILFIGVAVNAQTSGTSNPTSGRENDPYSKYGIGEFWNGNNTVLRGMANATSAFENPYQVNTDNPASYSFLQRTTFEAGAMASTRNITASGMSYTTGTASIAYLNLGLPVSKNSGLCIGFRPYTRSYYYLTDTLRSNSNPPSPIGDIARVYNGEGNLNYAFIGAAGKYKGFSAGINFGYMFGTQRNTTDAIPIDSLVTNRARVADYSNYIHISGIYWKGGVMYEGKVDSDYTIRIGGTFTLSQKLNERLDAYQTSIFNYGDTLDNYVTSYPGTQYGKLKLPLSYSIGAMLVKNDKWGLAVDFTGTQWSGFRSLPDTSLEIGVAKQSYKISAGGEYTPDANNIRNYFSRMTYRLGFYYGTDYLNLNNTNLPYYGVTAGTSLPFRRSFSKLHFSLDVGRLGVTTNNLLQETYVRFTLGISFNDKWFIPRKYD